MGSENASRSLSDYSGTFKKLINFLKLFKFKLQDGFMWEIDGNDITDKKCKLAANKRGLKSFGSERRLRDLKGKHYDLVIVGSVAVCPK